MNRQTFNPALRRPGIPSQIKYLLIAALLLVLVGGAVMAYRARAAVQPGRPAASMPINPAIEQRWGVRVKQIGVTADGGMVDFRFVVLDADKAFEMMQDVNNLPVLIAEDSHTVVNSTAAMAARHDLNVGQTYFLLYRNTRGAVKSGTAVTVKFGDLQLEHVRAQ